MKLPKDKGFMFFGLIPSILLVLWLTYQVFAVIHASPVMETAITQYKEQDEFTHKMSGNQVYDQVITLQVTEK